MRTTSFLLLSLGILLYPLSASAQSKPIEVGFDATYARYSVEGSNAGPNDVAIVSIPSQGFRVGFFLSNLISLETNLSHEFTSFDGEDASDFSFQAGLQYHLAPPVQRTTFYLGAAGAINIVDNSDQSDTQFGISGEAGFKLHVSDRVGFRLAGQFLRAFESEAYPAFNGIGASAGVSFFAR